MPILQGKKVTKNFGGLTALDAVDFVVNEGEILGLIGPNGAGKTTLFNLISGAINARSGEVLFKDKNITRLKAYQIARLGIARTFQAVKIFPDMTVLQHILLSGRFAGAGRVKASEAEPFARETLAFVGLAGLENVLAQDLPLDKQKRLEVARALATRPEILMLDELMAGLNPAEVAEAMGLVSRIRARGITVMMIEHVMKAIMGICDRIIVLNYGEKIAEGTPQQISSSQEVIEVYLGE